MTERYVRWDATSEEFPPSHEYRFIVVGDKKMCNSIRKKITELFKPTEFNRLMAEGKITKSNLKYFVIGFTSYGFDPTKMPAIISQLYRGDVKRNRDICSRESDHTLIELVERKAEAGETLFF